MRGEVEVHQQLFVHTGVSQGKMVLGEDKLWFNPNDEQIQKSMQGATCGGEVCVSPPLLGRIYSPWVHRLDQGSVPVTKGQCIPTENLREDDGNTFVCCNVFFFLIHIRFLKVVLWVIFIPYQQTIHNAAVLPSWSTGQRPHRLPTSPWQIWALSSASVGHPSKPCYRIGSCQLAQLAFGKPP